MQPEIIITIPGRPVPWARAQGGKFTKHFTPPRQRAHMNAIKLIAKLAMRGHKIFTGPVELKLIFTYKGNRGWKPSVADLDNLTKLVADSCNKILWKDDAQVCILHAMKLYNTEEKTEIRVKPLELQ